MSHVASLKKLPAPVKKNIKVEINKREVERIIRFEEEEPFEILGPHFLPDKKGLAIRTFQPRSTRAWVRKKNSRNKIAMEKIHPNGVYQAVFEKELNLFPYLIGFIDIEGHVVEIEDPYAFQPLLQDLDLHLLAEGQHWKSYDKLGSQLVTINGVSGVHFAVWAPNAKAVSVVGNFNRWMSGAHPLTRIHFSGFWGLFIPGLKEGEVYKFAIKSSVDHEVRFKIDPYAFQAELRPQTAAVVTSLKHHKWHDQKWIDTRSRQNALEHPLSIYEVHLGSWKKEEKKGWGFMNYRDLAHQLVDYVHHMGYTHIELMPVMEHPLDESWGYQVMNYYAPTSRFGSAEDFMYFVDYCHQHNVGVILDWVPAHFPKDAHGLAYYDGKQIYAYENWKKGEHREWGTYVFDYGRGEVRNFLLSNALFWLDHYHIDGLRVDAVASMIYLDYSRKDGEWEPNIFGGRENLEAIEFIKQFNEVVHARFPGVLTIAEESTAWPKVSRPTYLHGLGFSMKWNMGWMHDSLNYFSKDPIYRKHHQGTLTFSLLYAFSENFVLPISHDEIVYGKHSLIEKMPGEDYHKFANLRLFLSYMFCHPGKKLLFMGCDFAQRSEWNWAQSLDWHFLQYQPHHQINQLVRDLNLLYRENKALHELDFDSYGFEWIDFTDAASSVLSFMRRSRNPKEIMIVVCNMTPVPRWGYRVGVPFEGFYREVLNTDAWEYGGSGIGNYGGTFSQQLEWQNRPYSLRLNLPPLSTVVLTYEEL
jgi:1,4-alpha-glucan branching enzyme